MSAILVNSGIQPGTADAVSLGPINFAGSNLIVLALVYHSPAALSGPSDGVNTYIPLTEQTVPGGGRLRFYYAFNPNVGSPLTITASGTGIAPALAALGFSNIKSNPFDAENGNFNAGTPNTITTNIATPTDNNELFIAAMSHENTFSGLTIDVGFASPPPLQAQYNGGVNYGLAVSYLNQIGNTPLNPQFAWTNNHAAAAVIATFKAESTPTTLMGGSVGYC